MLYLFHQRDCNCVLLVRTGLTCGAILRGESSFRLLLTFWSYLKKPPSSIYVCLPPCALVCHMLLGVFPLLEDYFHSPTSTDNVEFMKRMSHGEDLPVTWPHVFLCSFLRLSMHQGSWLMWWRTWSASPSDGMGTDAEIVMEKMSNLL